MSLSGQCVAVQSAGDEFPTRGSVRPYGHRLVSLGGAVLVLGIWLNGIIEPRAGEGALYYVVISLLAVLYVSYSIRAAIRQRVEPTDIGVRLVRFASEVEVPWADIGAVRATYFGLEVVDRRGVVHRTSIFGRPRYRDLLGTTSPSRGERLADHLAEVANEEETRA